MVSFEPAFHSPLTLIKRLFSSSLSAIRVCPAYLRLLIFLPAILIPACASSSPAFLGMYSAYKLNKQGDSRQPWHTPFPIWNQSVVLCPVLTVASWPAYRFLRRQVRWSGIPISSRIFQFVVVHEVKGFGIVNKAEVDVFLEHSCFFDDPVDVGNLISGSSDFLKPTWSSGSSRFKYCWSLAWRTLSITVLVWQRRQWQPTSVLLPGKSLGQWSLVGCSPWGCKRVGQDWMTSLSVFTLTHWRRKWQPTPLFLPGESQGRQSLVDCCLWGCTESDTTEAT